MGNAHKKGASKSKNRQSSGSKSASRPKVPPPVKAATTAAKTALPDDADIPDRPDFWRNLLQALDTVPRDVSSMKGASGISHDVTAIGVDEEYKRLVVITKPEDSRSAAFAQADIQGAVPDHHVLVMRPAIVGTSDLVGSIKAVTGSTRFMSNSFLVPPGQTEDEIKARIEPYFEQFGKIAWNWFGNAKSVRSVSLAHGMNQLLSQLSMVRFSLDEESGLSIDLTGLLQNRDELMDYQLGTCTLPLHRFNEEQMDLVQGGRDLQAIRDVLSEHNVYQYFYPAPDQLVLGAIDRGVDVRSERPLAIAQGEGHPLGANEILSTGTTDVRTIIDELVERKLVVEGEYSLDLSEQGSHERVIVRFTPREGLVSKIVNRISVNIDLKSLLSFSVGKGGGDGSDKS